MIFKKQITLIKSDILFSIFLSLLLTCNIYAQQITIDGNTFRVYGKEIFMNGVNTPWDHWNDFGGNYDHSFWDSEFQEIREAGGNSSRIWISCNGDVGIDISAEGNISGATQAHWEDLDDMFALAAQHHVYIMATLTSFDHTKNTYTKYQRWRNMMADSINVGSYVGNYVIPFIDRYKDNPYLWCIDVCNEIEWMHENSECGNIPWEKLQYFVARVADAVHENSTVLVTLGSAAVKWNSDCTGCEGNFWSDANLRAQYNSPGAFLDFYSPHFYGWTVRWFGNFALDKTPDDYGMNDRPCMVGENPAKGVFTQNTSGQNVLTVPISEAFIKTYQQGWKGLLVWTSNGVDGNGSLTDCGPGLAAFESQYPELVSPDSANTKTTIIHDSKYLIWPNPASDFVHFSRPAGREVEVNIFDLFGKRVYNSVFRSFEDPVMDLRSFNPGAYLVVLNSGRELDHINLLVL